MDLFLLTLNKKKVFESKLIPFFYNLDHVAKRVIIKYHKNIDLNREILQFYNERPDIIIINFNRLDTDILPIKNKSVYPIIYNGVLYITPVCIEQINGFSNTIKEKEALLQDTVERILYSMGGILTEEKYSDMNILIPKNKNKNKNKNIMTNGIKDQFTDFRRESIVNQIPEWMLTGISKNRTGWFAIENSMAIDYVMLLYGDRINNIAELGSYFGKSTRYLASKKRDNCNLFAFDDFKNVLLTDYVITNPNPLDFKYFLNRFKFEGFHKNLAKFSNIYSIKYDCFKAAKWLKRQNINVDLFYLDFCKNDNKLIRVVDEIFNLYPDAIVIGDDAQWLSSSLEYFSKKYNYIYCKNCYICSNRERQNREQQNREQQNRVKFMNQLKTNWKHENCMVLEDVVKLDIEYRIKFIMRYITKLINNGRNQNKIDRLLDKLAVDPNKSSRYIVQGGNIFHWIAMNYQSDNNRESWLSLYDKITEKYQDKNELNFMDLTPNDYFNYNLTNFV